MARKIQESFYTLDHPGCHGVDLSASRPPSGRRSPAALIGRRLPAPPCSSTPTEETLLRLLDLDARDDDDSDDDYSFLNAHSAISSLGHSSCSRMARAALPSEGTSPVPLFATPVRTGGKPHAHREGGIGGFGGGGIRPATRTSTKAHSGSTANAESPSKIFIPKNADTPQVCIFIAKAERKALCFGKVGSSKCFYLALKEPGHSHCGVAAHGRTSKFSPNLDAFYVPGGIVSGHPTAMMDPYIHQESVPSHMLSKFDNSSLSADKWIGLIQAAVLYDNVVADEDDGSKREEDFVLGQQEEEKTSTIGSEIDEGEDEAAFDFQWEAPLWMNWRRTGLQPPVHIARHWNCWAGSSSPPPNQRRGNFDPSREYSIRSVGKLPK